MSGSDLVLAQIIVGALKFGALLTVGTLLAFKRGWRIMAPPKQKAEPEDAGAAEAEQVSPPAPVPSVRRSA